MLSTFRGVSLRQVIDADLPFLFRLFADPERRHLWTRDRRVYDERGFEHVWAAWSAEAMGDKFLVEAAGAPTGLVFDYDRAVEDGTTKVTALVTEERTGRGGGVVATALLVDWLFKSLPFRKVYLDVFGYNPSVLSMLRKLGIGEEGVLKGDRYWDGAYWDLHVFAIHRAAWPGIRARILRTPGEKRNGALRAGERVIETCCSKEESHAP
jgi:RimJ/RimL family protein N-acetyltransferase